MFLRDLFRFLPRSPLRRALGAMNRGEFESAAALLEGMLQPHSLPPEDLSAYACEAYLEAAKQRRDAGDVAGAVRCLERAAALRPGFADVHFRLGEMQEHADQPEVARSAYERAHTLNPRYFEARLALARILTHSGESAVALRHLREAAPQAPEALSRVIARMLAETVEGDGSDTRARLEALFADLVSAPPTPVAEGIEAARRALRTGDNLRAIAGLKSLLQQHPRFPDLHNLLGVAYDTEGMLDDAVEEFERAVALNPDYAEARLNLGLGLFHRSRHEEAARHLRWVEKKHPGHALVRSVLAQIESLARPG